MSFHPFNPEGTHGTGVRTRIVLISNLYITHERLTVYDNTRVFYVSTCSFPGQECLVLKILILSLSLFVKFVFTCFIRIRSPFTMYPSWVTSTPPVSFGETSTL